MWPRLPRTLPEPPQCGHGTGPNSTWPAPRQPAQRFEAHEVHAAPGALHRLVEAHARRLLQVLAAGGASARGLGGLEDLAEAHRSTRTLASKSKPSKPPSARGATGSAASSPRS